MNAYALPHEIPASTGESLAQFLARRNREQNANLEGINKLIFIINFNIFISATKS